tara:strand:+ start:6005 stop:6898 length:894 start_codon:yes stop_codon:yes gene_type:complete
MKVKENILIFKALFILILSSISFSQEMINYEVTRGETLWSIADRYKILDLTVGQTANYIYENNPDAFDGGIGNLLIGSILIIPQALDGVSSTLALDDQSFIDKHQDLIIENESLLLKITELEEEQALLSRELGQRDLDIYSINQELEDLDRSYQALHVDFEEISESRKKELAEKDQNIISSQEAQNNEFNLKLLINIVTTPFFLIGFGVGIFIISILFIFLPSSQAKINITERGSSYEYKNDNDGLDPEAGINMKLDLAQAYIDMGDIDKALSVLETVLVEGDLAQQKEAKKLIDSL